MATALDQFPDEVRSKAQFSVNTGETPVAVVQEVGHGSDRRIGTYEDHEIVIRNGRPIAGTLDLDRQGFTFQRYETAVKDFYNEAEVRSV